jgi:hypothetical protein
MTRNHIKINTIKPREKEKEERKKERQKIQRERTDQNRNLGNKRKRRWNAHIQPRKNEPKTHHKRD